MGVVQAAVIPAPRPAPDGPESLASVPMQHLLAPVASRTPTSPAAPPTLRAGDEQCPLVPGVHALGGRAPDAVPLAALQSQPRAAILTVSEEGVTVLQRTTASVVVRVDGEPIGIAPLELKPGTRIEFGDCRLWFEAEGSAAASAMRTTAEQSAVATATQGGRVLPLNGTGG